MTMATLEKIDELINALCGTIEPEESKHETENESVLRGKLNIFVSLTYTPLIENLIDQLKKAGHTIYSCRGRLETKQEREAYLNELKNGNNKFDALLIAGGDKVCTNEFLEMMPNLKVISTISAGCDHIDIEYCTKRKIHVLNISVKFFIYIDVIFLFFDYLF